jgi:hypothetical protein
MTNEEAIEKLKELKTVATNENYAFDCARKLAIKALKNQAKYEHALKMAVKDGNKAGVDIYCAPAADGCPYSEDGRLSYCCECGTAYYKHKAGIEDDAK